MSSETLLTTEALRHLADQVPGFVQALAEALAEPLEKPAADFLERIETGNVSNAEALAALAQYAITLRDEVVHAVEDRIFLTGTSQQLSEYRAAHGLPDD